jgi:VCBS repeat-containing protein
MQMKNTNKKSILISGFCLILLTVLFSVSQAHAQTITYKGDVKLPPPLIATPIRMVNDSGLNATDRDVPSDPSDRSSVSTNSRVLLNFRVVYTMYNDANGKPYFVRTLFRAGLRTDSLNERHNNLSPTLSSGGDTPPNITGNYGLGVYQLLNPFGYNLVAHEFVLPSEARAMSHGGIYGGKTTTILSTIMPGNILQLYSVDVGQIEGGYYLTPTMIIPSDTPNADLVLAPAPAGVFWNVSQTFGTDGNLYVLDPYGKRILAFDLGLNGGTRGKLLSSFSLDQTKPADNSLTMDFAGNLYVGDGAGGFNMYSKEGQWKMGFSDTYMPDPNIRLEFNGSVNSYMNFYASGLNDGNGTLDIYDITGYRQYTIKASNNTPINTPPTAANDSYSTDEDTTLTAAAASGVIANDNDNENDDLTATLLTSPSHAASFTLNPDGSFSYTPAANFHGSDSFTYKANDGTVDSNIATVTITVNPVNDAPDAVNDPNATTSFLSPLTIMVLANDTDVDGDTLTITGVTQPAKGAVTIAADKKSVLYTPVKGFAGTFSFTYTLSDGTLSDTATVTVAVTAPGPVRRR